MECRYSLLALLLFLSLVYPCTGNTDPKTVKVFEDTKTEVFEKENEKPETKRTPLAFGAPAFVGGMVNGKEFLAIMSDASYVTSSDKPLLEPVVRTSNGEYRQWSNANVIFNRTVNTQNKRTKLGKVTAVMNKDKIYVIATTFEASPTLDIAHNNDIPSDSILIVGTLVTSPTPSNKGSVTIMWGEEKSIKSLLKITENAKGLPYIVGGMGNGVVMKNGTIVLPIQIKYKYKQYDSASIIYSDDGGENWKMGKKTISGSSEGSVVEFNEGKLLLSVHSSKGFRAVYETVDMGATWRPSETFMAVWGNQKFCSLLGNQGSVITAPVKGKDVLLFSHPLNMDESHTRETLQLWVSDGQRIALVGTISEDKKGEHTGNSILAYVNNKLYITHEIIPHAETQASDDITGRNKVIAVTHLQEYFEHVQKIVLAWRALDTKIVHAGDISTDGLVGFLGNAKGDDEVWTDKYNCVNATVKGATPVKGGFSFSGKTESGAQWPVASQGQNQLYKFTRKQFTLAATVKLHNTGETEDVMLLGASVNTAEKKHFLIGIGCSKSKKWYTFYDDKRITSTTLSCKVDEEYHVALTFAYGVAHFYLNGSYLAHGRQTNSKTHVIQQFFMGKIENDLITEGSMCTVKNVMLFNQRLKQRKIFHLFRVSNNSSLDKLTDTEELALLPVSHPSAQKTQPATIILSDNSVQKTNKPAPQPVSHNAEQTGDSQNLPVPPNAVQPSTPATTTVIHNSAQPDKLPNIPVHPNSVQITKPAITPVSGKTLSTKTSAQGSVTEKHKMFNASETEQHLDNALSEQQSATLKKHLKPTDSSANSFAFFQLLCVVCSVVLFAQV